MGKPEGLTSSQQAAIQELQGRKRLIASAKSMREKKDIEEVVIEETYSQEERYDDKRSINSSKQSYTKLSTAHFDLEKPKHKQLRQDIEEEEEDDLNVPPSLREIDRQRSILNEVNEMCSKTPEPLMNQGSEVLKTTNILSRLKLSKESQSQEMPEQFQSPLLRDDGLANIFKDILSYINASNSQDEQILDELSLLVHNSRAADIVAFLRQMNQQLKEEPDVEVYQRNTQILSKLCLKLATKDGSNV